MYLTFRPKFDFLTKFSIFEFLTNKLIFDQKFDFFDQNVDFWPKFWFLTKVQKKQQSKFF